MGKKTKRKTRWRTFPIGDVSSPNEDDGEEAGSTSPSAQPRRQRTSELRYNNILRFSKQSAAHYTTHKQKLFNEDEYTKITTPRQDVLFKKGYLGRRKPVTTPTVPVNVGNGDYPDCESDASSETLTPHEQIPVLYSNGCVQEMPGGPIFYLNGSYEVYEPYTSMNNSFPMRLGNNGDSILTSVTPMPLPPVEWINPRATELPPGGWCLVAPAGPILSLNMQQNKYYPPDIQNHVPCQEALSNVPLPSPEHGKMLQHEQPPAYVYTGYMFAPPPVTPPEYTMDGVASIPPRTAPPPPLPLPSNTITEQLAPNGEVATTHAVHLPNGNGMSNGGPADLSGSPPQQGSPTLATHVDTSSSAHTKRRKKKRRRKRKRGFRTDGVGTDDGSEDSSSEEVAESKETLEVSETSRGSVCPELHKSSSGSNNKQMVTSSKDSDSATAGSLPLTTSESFSELSHTSSSQNSHDETEQPSCHTINGIKKSIEENTLPTEIPPPPPSSELDPLASSFNGTCKEHTENEEENIKDIESEKDISVQTKPELDSSIINNGEKSLVDDKKLSYMQSLQDTEKIISHLQIQCETERNVTELQEKTQNSEFKIKKNNKISKENGLSHEKTEVKNNLSVNNMCSFKTSGSTPRKRGRQKATIITRNPISSANTGKPEQELAKKLAEQIIQDAITTAVKTSSIQDKCITEEEEEEEDSCSPCTSTKRPITEAVTTWLQSNENPLLTFSELCEEDDQDDESETVSGPKNMFTNPLPASSNRFLQDSTDDPEKRVGENASFIESDTYFDDPIFLDCDVKSYKVRPAAAATVGRFDWNDETVDFSMPSLVQNNVPNIYNIVRRSSPLNDLHCSEIYQNTGGGETITTPLPAALQKNGPPISGTKYCNNNYNNNKMHGSVIKLSSSEAWLPAREVISDSGIESDNEAQSTESISKANSIRYHSYRCQSYDTEPFPHAACCNIQ